MANEAFARVKIDQRLRDAAWPLTDGQTVRYEYKLADGGKADYALFDRQGRALAVRKAKGTSVSLSAGGAQGGRLADVEQLPRKGGWARVAKLKIVTPKVTREYLVLSVAADEGPAIHSKTVERLLRVPAKNEPVDGTTPEEQLKVAEAERRKAPLYEAQQQNAEWLDLESEKLDDCEADLERAVEAEIKTIEAETHDARRVMRGSSLPMAEKLAEKRRLCALEGKQDKMKAESLARRAKILEEVHVMLGQFRESLRPEPTLTDLFTVRWEAA